MHNMLSKNMCIYNHALLCTVNRVYLETLLPSNLCYLVRCSIIFLCKELCFFSFSIDWMNINLLKIMELQKIRLIR